MKSHIQKMTHGKTVLNSNKATIVYASCAFLAETPYFITPIGILNPYIYFASESDAKFTELLLFSG
jgi:hypothetical protein